MNIENLKTSRQKLETSIIEAINNFQSETGVCPTIAGVKYIYEGQPDNTNRKVAQQVDISIEI